MKSCTFPNSASAPSACRASKPSTRSQRPRTRLPPHRHRPDLRQRGRGRPGAAGAGVARGRLRHHQDLDREPGRRQADPEPEGQPAQAAPRAARPDPDPLAFAGRAVPVAESMQALLEARELGLTGAIGVSNFTNACWRRRSTRWARPTSPPTRSSCIPSCRTAGGRLRARTRHPRDGLHAAGVWQGADDPVIGRSPRACMRRRRRWRWRG
jgi:hypothetical protein